MKKSEILRTTTYHNNVDLSKAKVGDIIVRALGGHPMTIEITEVKDGIITAGLGWTFDQKTGMEIDEHLDWGPKHGVTGSFITHIIE